MNQEDSNRSYQSAFMELSSLNSQREPACASIRI